MKSQAAFEFLTVVAIGLIIIAASSMFGMNYLTSYSQDINSLNAERFVKSVTSFANLVYSQGVGASIQLKVTVPDDVSIYRTYIYKNKIGMRLVPDSPADVSSEAATNMYGTIPIFPGHATLFLKMKEDGVHIYVDSVDLAYMGTKVFNDSSYSNEDYDFSVGETAYYSVALTDLQDNPKDSNLVIRIYNPTGTIVSEGTYSSSSGFYNSSVVLSDPGFWQITAESASGNLLSSVLVKAV